MKFRKPTDYEIRSQAHQMPRVQPAHEEPKLRPEDPMFFRYECIFCANYAHVLHKGTSYCRRCYEENNRLGRLVN